MKTIQQWRIYWDEYVSKTYLYGATLKYHDKKDVEYSNRLMPPGTVIKEWYSKTNYQRDRIEPSLPIIDGESQYKIDIDIESPQSEGIIVRLVFYDKYEMEAGDVIVRSNSMKFKCPLKTYSYRMQLINGGFESLRFHSISIKEIVDDTEDTAEEA